jgi:predicted nucleic acid-binding protein
MDSLRGHKRVLIDSSVWIYHFEQHPKFGTPATKAIANVEAGKFQGVVSELSLMELIVRPLQLGRQDVADEYELLLSHFPNVDLVPITREILLDAANLRAHYNVRTPDAILLATGLQAGATAAITNDIAWRKLPSLKIVLLTE